MTKKKNTNTKITYRQRGPWLTALAGNKELARTKITTSGGKQQARQRLELILYRKIAIPAQQQGEKNKYENILKGLRTYTKKETITRKLYTTKPLTTTLEYSHNIGVPALHTRKLYTNIIKHLDVKDHQLQRDIIKYRNKLLDYRITIEADLEGNQGIIGKITLYGVRPERANMLNWWLGTTITGSNKQLEDLQRQFNNEAKNREGQRATFTFYNEGTVNKISNVRGTFA